MLHVRWLSGEELATLPADDVRDVRAVKQRLHKTHGVPPRFRQRVLLDGKNLDDAAEVDASMDLHLLVLTLCGAQVEADSLVKLAEDGLVKEVEAMLQLPQDPNLPCLSLVLSLGFWLCCWGFLPKHGFPHQEGQAAKLLGLLSRHTILREA